MDAGRVDRPLRRRSVRHRLLKLKYRCWRDWVKDGLANTDLVELVQQMAGFRWQELLIRLDFGAHDVFKGDLWSADSWQ